MSKKMTKEQLNKKYRGKFIQILKTYSHEDACWMYEVVKSHKEIHENTTLGEDVGTEFEYRR